MYTLEVTMITKHNLIGCFLALIGAFFVQFGLPRLLVAAEPADIVQAQAILTVSESKRLIDKAVKEMLIVKNTTWQTAWW